MYQIHSAFTDTPLIDHFQLPENFSPFVTQYIAKALAIVNASTSKTAKSTVIQASYLISIASNFSSAFETAF